MTRKYMLTGHVPYQEKDLITWAKWFETSDKERTVAVTEVLRPHKATISTCFMSLEGVGQEKEFMPALFQSAVFGGPHAGFTRNVCTWEEAEAQHRKIFQALLEGRDPATAFA